MSLFETYMSQTVCTDDHGVPRNTPRYSVPYGPKWRKQKAVLLIEMVEETFSHIFATICACHDLFTASRTSNALPALS